MSEQLVSVGDINRTTYIGSSNAAAIMGLGAYGNTPLTCYLGKIGQGEEEMDPKQRLFLERRKRWEAPIVQILTEEFDGKIVAVNKRYRDPEFDFLAAEIDAEYADENGEIQNIEIKTCSPFAFGEKHGWGEGGSEEIPVHYAAQVMFSLMVTARQTCVVAAMVGLDSMIFYRIERDDETIAAIRERCVNFWIEHVLKKIPPDPISLADVMRLTLKMRGKPVEADDDLFENLRALNSIRESIKAMDGEKDEVMFKIAFAILKSWGIVVGPDEVVTASPDNAVILRAGEQVASWNLQQTTRIQAKELREAMPEIFAKFAKTTPSRVLRLKKPKA